MVKATLSRVSVVVLDWDETITVADTMSILANATNDPSRWSGFVDAYMADMKAYEDSFGTRETLEDHYRFLGGLSECEYKSVARIELAGVFKGVTHADIQRVASEVKIRSGFKEFCHKLGVAVEREILSVNWSSEFICSALANAVVTDHWTITANRIEFDGAGTGTGGVSKDKEGGIRTGMDKLRILESRLGACHERGGLLMYIGDSNTDLPALLAADIGVIFGDNRSLQQTCDKYGITVRSFSELCAKDYVEKEKESKVLYRARKWEEIILE
ncbi:UPF0655 protein C17G9.12c [Taphrina deformans PYCC 5710]|uniref:UPF0655 protein C17G9.12c n=1 Tax=Taphrina deformans (strain PYCC 5710 / ATCC 11124 / CBS 356.35 / IMI 108563 / JCM 9778 / NBRC 8474) TaxID=1097556 RepID=R4X9G5_TAPDE|nr:UPF0655 protein C17G9.12c [Taphrina deformans PYCC 5710]|eukprot:CCG80859.1 UPF0655 protein C17G9.12c [Taphrina deformans PYCC 5710]